MLILKALSLGPLHGYGVIQRIRQMSGEMLDVEQGSLYPAVYRIEQKGWGSSKGGRNENGRGPDCFPPTTGGRGLVEVGDERGGAAREVLLADEAGPQAARRGGGELGQARARDLARA